MKLYIATPINARQEPTMREKLVAAKHRVEMLKAIIANDVRFKDYDLISAFDFNDMNDTEEKAMSRCIYHVLTSVAIYLDHGWTASKGCNLEYLTAKIYGKRIFEHSEYKTKETMKTEENKRMLALSCIVADLKAENIELAQRVHQLVDEYNEVVRQLNGKETHKDEDIEGLLLRDMQKMRDHCDKLEKDIEQLKRQCVQLQTERNEAKTHADECELQKEELFKHIARFNNSEFLKIGDYCTHRVFLPDGDPVKVGSGICNSCRHLIKVDVSDKKCVLCACRYDNTKAEEAQECKNTDKKRLNMREFVIKALRNYGYRFLENQSGCYTFGKPLGYGILRADVREDENAVSVMLIVKGNKKDGKRPNLIWHQTSQGFLEEDDEQKMYKAFVQAIADCEADIFSKTSVAWSQNRDVRYDFEEKDVLVE